MGELDWEQLVAIEDHTDEVRSRASQIGGELDAFLAMIDRAEMPEAVFGKTKCEKCPFDQVCWGDEPEDSIIHLPRISAKKLDELGALGVERIPDIPVDYKLSKTQAPMLEAYSHPDGKLVEREHLIQWIEKLVYPLYYFDFETWNPCIPPFDKTWPYLQIPFQYSVHIQEEPGAEPKHREFLAEAEGDPRPELIERMIDDLGATGSIVVHHAEFETKRIHDLAVFSPAHRDALMAMLDRIVDTEIPFKKNWYLHPGLMGRSSIKVVLPTLAPELSYEEMKIGEGQTASLAFGDLIEGRTADEDVSATREALLDYCRLDTLAMVTIVEKLRAVLSG